MEEFLKINEVALILKVSPRTVLNMIYDKKINALSISGTKRKTYRVMMSEINRLIRKGGKKYDKNRVDL